jgi:hypothetical protein
MIPKSSRTFYLDEGGAYGMFSLSVSVISQSLCLPTEHVNRLQLCMKDWYNRGYVFMMFLPVTSPFSSDLRFKKNVFYAIVLE